jgi:hypothetical protein
MVEEFLDFPFGFARNGALTGRPVNRFPSAKNLRSLPLLL